MKTIKKIFALIVVFTMLLLTVSAAMPVSATDKYGEIEGFPVVAKYVIHTGEAINLSDIYRYEGTDICAAVCVGTNASVSIESEDNNAKRIVADSSKYGVNLIRIGEGNANESRLFGFYYIIVVVESDDVTVAQMNEIYKIDVKDLNIKYKGKGRPEVNIEKADADKDVCFTEYFVGNELIITQDNYISSNKTGTFQARCFIVDAQGHMFSEKFQVNVRYSFGQWLIRIFLFGWLWY